MDDSLRQLEERLEQLVPRGLGDRGRQCLEDQIDELAAETVRDERRKRHWPWAVGIAAGLGLACSVAFLPNWGTAPAQIAAESELAPEEVALAAFETLGFSQQVDDRFDGGTILGDGSEAPYRYWGYNLTETEEFLHVESGHKVHISSEREEGVLTRVTSF